MTAIFDTASSRDHPTDPSGLRNQRGHVLIIDDEPAILDVVTEILSDEGWHVTGMRSPPSVSAIQASSPNLILLDLLFNGQPEGLTLFDAIRAEPSTTTIPVVICTAIPWLGEMMKANRYQPAVTILPKPFELDDIIGTVETVAQLSIRAPNQD